MPAVAPTVAGRRSALTPLLPLILFLGMGGLLRAQVEVTPTPLRFDCTLLDADSTSTITVRSLDGQIIIRRFELDSAKAFFPPQGPRSGGDTISLNGSPRTYLVRFHPRTLGPFIDTLRILFSRPGLDERDTVAVPLLGKAVRPLITIASESGDFNEVPVDSTASRTIYLDNPSCRTIVLDTVLVDDDHGPGPFHLIRVPRFPCRIVDGGRDSIVVEFAPSEVGSAGVELKVRFNRSEELRYPLSGAGSGAVFAAHTSGIDFGKVPVGGSSTVREALFLNRGNTPLTIEKVWLTGADTSLVHVGDFDRTVLPARDGRDTASMLRLPVLFTPSTTSPVAATIHLRTASGQDAEMQVAGVGTSDIRMEPSRLEFGPVMVNTTRSLIDTVELINDRSEPLVIDDVIWQGGGAGAFELLDIPQPPFSIKPGARLRFGARFRPGAEGEYQARALFRFDNGGGIDLDLRGLGVTPRLEWTDGNQQVFLGQVPIGVVGVPDTLYLVNRGDVAAEIDTVVIDGQVPGRDQFILVDIVGPRRLRPLRLDDHDTLACIVVFAPQAAPSIGTSYQARLVVRTPGPVRDRELRGEVSGTRSAIEPGIVDFDSVYVGTTDTAHLTIRGGSTGLHIVGAGTRGREAGAFKALLAPSVDLPIAPNTDTTIELTFHPDTVGSYATLLILPLEGGGAIRVPLIGHGIDRPIRHVSVGDTSVDVNEPFVLGVHVDPPLVSDDHVQTFSARLVADRHALHFIGSDDPALQAVVRGDTIDITRTGSPITGGTLASLRFEGLVTGKPSNTVALVSAALDPLADSVDRTGGIVLLSGCDVGRNLAFGRSAHVVAITPQPVGSVAALRYVAPEGTLPWVQIVDAAGQIRGRIELPVGTGAEQTGEVRLDHLPSGLYLVELRVGTQRSSVPVVIGDR